jgi:hypothetical protein
MAAKPHHREEERRMELDFLEESAPGLKSWLTDRGGYLFEERPGAIHAAVLELNAAGTDEWSDEQASH